MPGAQTGLRGLGLTEVGESTTAAGVRLLSAVIPRQEHDHVWLALRRDHSRTG
jgi:hypothetical protein